VSDTPWVHVTVEETERGWIVWVKVTTATRRYQGPATMYPFQSADAARAWVLEQFGPEVAGGGRVVDDLSEPDLG
jgi:hypothetical protein